MDQGSARRNLAIHQDVGVSITGSGGEFRIRVRHIPPIYISPHRRSIAEENKISVEVKKMLGAGIIEPSASIDHHRMELSHLLGQEEGR